MCTRTRASMRERETFKKISNVLITISPFINKVNSRQRGKISYQHKTLYWPVSLEGELRSEDGRVGARGAKKKKKNRERVVGKQEEEEKKRTTHKPSRTRLYKCLQIMFVTLTRKENTLRQRRRRRKSINFEKCLSTWTVVDGVRALQADRVSHDEVIRDFWGPVRTRGTF